MSRALITESYLTGIANAIRAKLGVQTQYKPPQMAAAIQSIPTGGSPVLEALSVTQNGVYTPGAGVDGYSGVTVAVPNTYAAADEGKVVQSGALAAQSSRTITANGTYDTTANNQVTVNVSGGGGGGGAYTRTEMSSVLNCYLMSGGGSGWAVYPSTSLALGAETFYADIPVSYPSGGLILLTTERPAGASFQFTRNRIGFTDGTEDPASLPDGVVDGRTTAPAYYLNGLSSDKTKQMTLVKIPSGMKRVYWTNTQGSNRVAGQKSWIWFFSDADLEAAMNIEWLYYISNSNSNENTFQIQH